MRVKYVEWLFAIMMISFIYIVFLTDSPFSWKIICMAIYGTIILYTVLSLWLENRPAQNTLLWTYILLLLPVLGYIFCVYSGQLQLKGDWVKRKRNSDQKLYEALNGKKRSTDLSHLTPQQRCFSSYLERVTLNHQSENTMTKILMNGEETFQEIKQKLKEANDFIHLEYYIFRFDRLGQEIIAILKDKVQEGVEVRLIYDAFGSFALTESICKNIQEAGIEIKPFLPISLAWYNQRLNFRNHRKIIIIDGKIGFVGGLNVGIEYLGEDEEIGFWCDTHVMLEGEALQTLHAVFILDWKFVSGEKLFEQKRYLKPVSTEGDGLVHVVATGPETEDMSDHFYSMISCATESIWIATPYFIPNQSIQTALKIAAHKGIQVRLMVPEVNDGFLTQYATQSYFPELLRAGIEVYSYQKGFLHKKVMIVDGNLASIGTANLDMRSFHLNFEVNLFLIGTNSSRDLVTQFEEDLQECQRIDSEEFKKRSKTTKYKESFARLFSGVL